MHRLCLILIVIGLGTKVIAQTKNGFDLSNSSISIDEIKNGGPEKDGIPSIDNPDFITTPEATLKATDRILGVKFMGVAKAYPIKILNYHEIVNDYFNEHPVVITYCPLCGSGIAFDAIINGKPLTFGVSGLLYNSDVLLYDRQTESLWSQLKYQSISGKLKGNKLVVIQTENTTWQSWKNRYPNTLLLSEKTGYSRDYSNNPYPYYEESSQLYFPVKAKSKDFHPKEMILGVEINNNYKAYPLSELAKLKKNTIEDNFSGEDLTILFNSESNSARLTNTNSEIISISTYWFAWHAFHPDTEIFRAN